MSKSKEAFTEMRQKEQGRSIGLDGTPNEYKLGQYSSNPMQEPQSTALTINSKSFIELDKEALRDKSMAIVDYYLDGFNSPTEGLIFAKKLTEMAEDIKENLADAATNELKLAKSEKRSLHSCDINEQMTGVRYDFKNCNDLAWNRAKAILDEREAFLKTVKGEQITGDPATGETWMAKEPVKSGKMSLIIKLK
jgi:hypothetical protein